MSGFLETIGMMLYAFVGIIIGLAVLIILWLLGIAGQMLLWIDVLMINVWVAIDRLLGSLAFWPAPISWAVICGALGFLMHLGCSRVRR